MELDKELRDKITETARDVRHICEQLKDGKETFREHKVLFEKQDERIRKLESNQQLLTGKMTLIVMGLGALMLFVANFIRELIFK